MGEDDANQLKSPGNRCGSFSLLSTLQIVGVLKIMPHSYPWLEVDIGKIVCPLFCSSKYGNPRLSYTVVGLNLRRYKFFLFVDRCDVACITNSYVVCHPYNIYIYYLHLKALR